MILLLFFFDYLIPFGLITAICGLFSQKAQKRQLNRAAIISGVLIAGFARYIMHSLSGVIFFSDYADGKNVWIYSFIIYNLPYMLASTIITLVFVLILNKQLINLESRIK